MCVRNTYIHISLSLALIRENRFKHQQRLGCISPFFSIRRPRRPRLPHRNYAGVDQKSLVLFSVPLHNLNHLLLPPSALRTPPLEPSKSSIQTIHPCRPVYMALKMQGLGGGSLDLFHQSLRRCQRFMG